ncbi:Nif3-like dinuclear metal center hexameric protein [Mesoplasma photuris]|uniref:Nif3-like dinuclear metal center hexameric protein n=1 Tax=Mesoplasma photuris TaxID=217731 RepID=UPI0004E0B5B5|nr:Nif3-like dinuclear metal center hexameric protein [Mesoplasma photuris]
MKLDSLIKYLEKKFKPSLAASWDYSGFQLFNGKKINIEKEIENVLICLDFTLEVFEKIKKENYDLIISRHPFIFGDLKQNKKDPFKKEAIKFLKQNNIDIYSIHTNYDASKNQEMFSILENALPVKSISRWGLDKEGFEINLKTKLSLENINKILSKEFKSDFTFINSDEKEMFDNFKLVSGSGFTSVIETSQKNILFVTGEMKWNEYIYAESNNISVIVLGHYMENYFIKDIENKIAERFGNTVNVNSFDIKNQFKVIENKKV